MSPLNIYVTDVYEVDSRISKFIRKMNILKFIGLIGFLIAGNVYGNIVNARLESCPSCTLNRKPEIKAFAYEDLPKYGIEFRKIHGHLPELVFFNEDDKEIERHSLSNLSRQECNDLLLSRGFSPKNEDL